jgi:hypothetical protein
MADTTILNGDVGVTWFANNRQKRLEWIGGTNNEYTMNELYSAMQTLQDEETTIDDGTCFSAETPVEYTIGKIDQGDAEPWYISYDLMEHITGGALRTSGWTRVQDTNTGIVCVQVDSGGAIVASDAGYDIVHDDGDTGTLLEFIDTGGAVDYCIIRPDSSAIGNSFDAASSDQLTCNAHVADVLETDGVATTGEQIWANLYTIGTIDPEVHIYLYQGGIDPDGTRTRLFSWNSATLDWYGNGHIDRAVALKDMTASTWSIIDGGYITARARKSGDLYASFEVSNSTTSGGRNPIPLQTSNDLNQVTGIKKELTGAWSTAYVDGEVIEGGTSGARGIVDLANSTADTHLVYFPIAEDDASGNYGGALTDFQDAETITGADSGCTSTSSGTPADFGPADSGWYSGSGVPTVSFTATEFDVDNDGTDEEYGITIDCNQNRLDEVYEWAKWQTRYGEVANDLDGINGELYNGATAAFIYTSISGTIGEGESVTGATSGAIGVVISHDTTDKYVLLRSTRGSFQVSENVEADDDSDQFTNLTTAYNFAASTASPLGTFAGGTFFGARGVLLSDWNSLDENAFILTDIDGGAYERPQSFSITVSNLQGDAATSDESDLVAVYRLTGSGGSIDKTEYDCVGGEAAGASTITVGSAIANDVPGSTTGGKLVLVDDPAGTGDEYVIRYASWSGTVFTLNELTGTTESGTNATTLVDDEATFTDGADQVYRGDLVYVSGKGYAYVKTVDNNTTLTLAGAGISGFTSSDTYEINVPPVAITSSDDVYIPLIHTYATSGSTAVSLQYVATIYFRVRVRNTRDQTAGEGPIKPYSSDGSSAGTDQTIQVVRTDDTIIT